MAMSNPGDVLPNTVFGTSNVERKKYDPIYEIHVQIGEEEVIYVGRLFTFGVNPNLLTVKGTRIVPQKKKSAVTLSEQDMIQRFESDPSVEDSFPIVNFKLIRKIA